MSERYVPLACCSCAAPIRVPERACRFSCGWCHTVQQLVFEGGAYFSEPWEPSGRPGSISDEIAFAPTDTRAAKASLAGLESEIESLESEYRRVLWTIAQSYDSRLDRVRRREEGIFGCSAMAISIVVISVLLVPQLSRNNALGLAVAVGIALVIALGALGWHHENRADAEELRDESLDRLAAVRERTERELRQLAGEIERTRLIAQSSAAAPFDSALYVR